MSLKPIFIMGAPRSGTTLLASLLASRKEVLALPEMHYIHNLLREEIVFGTLSVSEIATCIYNDFTFRSLEISKDIEDVLDLVGGSTRETIVNIIERYNRKYWKKEFQFWVEHSPHNHKFFQVLRHHFPNAKFLNIVRDGRAVYASTIDQQWGYKDIVTGSRSWQQDVENCLQLSNMFPKKVLTVKYENLVSYPEAQLKEICSFLGTQFDNSMLKSNGLIFSRFEQKNGKTVKTLGPPNTNSIKKWKLRLKHHEIRFFTEYNRKLLEYYGYEVENYHGPSLNQFHRTIYPAIGKFRQICHQRILKKTRSYLLEK